MNLKGKTNQELLEMKRTIESNPANQQTGSLFKFSKSARAKLDKIDWAITDNLRAARIARGETIDVSGYSGRQTNKR